MIRDTGKLYDDIFPLLFANDSGAMHYGLWKFGVFTFAGAQRNENAVLARKVGVKKGDRVLDAGTGIGGSAFWLAKNVGASVLGISLGKKEIAKAVRTSRRLNVDGDARFSVSDFHSTGLASGSFDIAWAIESVLYSDSKELALSEFFRVLRPGGRVVIADLFAARTPRNDHERTLLERFSERARVAPLSTVDEFVSVLERVGFVSIEYTDVRSSIIPTSLLYLANSLSLYPFVFAFDLVTFGKVVPRWLIDYLRMAIIQWRGIASGVMTYGIFVAQKPDLPDIIQR